ncbi:ATV_HP_G0093510.mRNA.1.CDS.1 [Saccharomyces cerevisiae]|nr:ATV_HP_G0093510.mRNA.1.CDS.1 [Saccharomyces cerevisiae]CAI6516421.1 ATV_HP_G0093510.mRNA.1.CDS.1 [Saccharomyces cerevisiae]
MCVCVCAIPFFEFFLPFIPHYAFLLFVSSVRFTVNERCYYLVCVLKLNCAFFFMVMIFELKRVCVSYLDRSRKIQIVRFFPFITIIFSTLNNKI